MFFYRPRPAAGNEQFRHTATVRIVVIPPFRAPRKLQIFVGEFRAVSSFAERKTCVFFCFITQVGALRQLDPALRRGDDS